MVTYRKRTKPRVMKKTPTIKTARVKQLITVFRSQKSALQQLVFLQRIEESSLIPLKIKAFFKRKQAAVMVLARKEAEDLDERYEREAHKRGHPPDVL